jgi:hypothetical protein
MGDDRAEIDEVVPVGQGHVLRRQSGTDPANSIHGVDAGRKRFM